jgi:hypothetical protein
MTKYWEGNYQPKYQNFRHKCCIARAMRGAPRSVLEKSREALSEK